jgi:hypothetical protein
VGESVAAESMPTQPNAKTSNDTEKIIFFSRNRQLCSAGIMLLGQSREERAAGTGPRGLPYIWHTFVTRL